MVSTTDQSPRKVAYKRKSASVEDFGAAKRCCLGDETEELGMEVTEFPPVGTKYPPPPPYKIDVKTFLPVYSHHGGTSGAPVQMVEATSNEVEMSDSQHSTGDVPMINSFAPNTPAKSDRFSHSCGKESPKGASAAVCCRFTTHYVSDIY